MPSDEPRLSSTWLAIVEQSLVDTIERLRDLPPGPRVRELRAKAEGFERALRTWSTRPPTEDPAQLVARYFEVLGAADKPESYSIGELPVLGLETTT